MKAERRHKLLDTPLGGPDSHGDDMNKLDTSYRPMLTCTCGLTRHVFAGAKRLDTGDVELRYRCSKCNTNRQWGMISIVDEYLDGVIEDVRPSKSA